MKHSFKLASAVVVAMTSVALGHGVQIQVTYNPSTNKIETRSVVATSTDATNLGFPLGNAGITPINRVYVLPVRFIDAFPGTASDPSGLRNGYYANPANLLNSSGVLRWPSGVGIQWNYDATATRPANAPANALALPGTGWALNGTESPNPTLPDLTGTRFGYTLVGGLRQWDGSAFAPDTSTTAQLQALVGDATGLAPFTTNPERLVTAADGENKTITNNPIGTNWSNSPHNSNSFRLLGDGSSATAAPADGIYLAQLRVNTSATLNGQPINSSDDIFFVFSYNQSNEDALAVAQQFATSRDIPLSQVQVAVPEPATLGVLATSAALLLRRRK